MIRKRKSLRSPVKREDAERFILLSLVSFAISVIVTRTFLQITGYPKLGNATLHIAHLLWGGLLLFIAALLPLIIANRWVFNTSAILSGVGVGLFIDEVGKFITQTNDYFFPPAAPIIYAFFLLTVLLYLFVRHPDKSTPRGMMYRILEDLTEVLDRDLQPHERDSMETRLAAVSQQSTDANIRELVVALAKFLDNKQLVLALHRPTLFQRIGKHAAPFFNRVFTPARLKAIIILCLGGLGVIALYNFALLLIAIPAPEPAIQVFFSPLVTRGQLRSAQETAWYFIRTMLEGGTGVMLITAGAFLTIGRNRIGILLGILGLTIWISIINLLVYYFDQFGAMLMTVIQFLVLTLVLYYRRRYLIPRLDPSTASRLRE